MPNTDRESQSNRIDSGFQEKTNPVSLVHVWNTPWTDPDSNQLRIVTAYPVYEAILNHVTAALPNETGGFLLGDVGYDEVEKKWHLYINHIETVSPVNSDAERFVFSWRDVERVRELRNKLGKSLIGWYHSHPDMGVFLSSTDLERTHFRLFNELFQIALVIDPIRGLAGYFCREFPDALDSSEQQWREFSISRNEDALSGNDTNSSPHPSQEPIYLHGHLSVGVAPDAEKIPMQILWDCTRQDPESWDSISGAVSLMRESLSGGETMELGSPQMIRPGVFGWTDYVPARLFPVKWFIKSVASSQIELAGPEIERQLIWNGKVAEGV